MRYKLVFDDHEEFVDAESPTEAVNAREGGYGSPFPHTMTDLSLIDRFTEPRPVTMPLRDRIRGVIA